MTTDSEPQRSLHTWKEIANFLGVSVRTVQLWEHREGLPIRRPPGQHSQVAADPEELQRWQAVRERRPPVWARPRVRAATVWIVPAMLLGILIHDLMEHHGWVLHPSPARVSVERNTLIALDERSKELWRYEFDRALDAESYTAHADKVSTRWILEDLEEDGRVEMLFVEVPATVGGAHRLHCFSSSGKKLWSYPDKLPDHPELITNLRTMTSGRKDRVILAHLCDLPEHKGTLLLLTARGERLSDYRHEGHLEQMVVDGSRIVMGGECTRHNCAELHLLRLANESGALKLTEERQVLFARSCVNSLLEQPHRVDGITMLPDGILVSVVEMVDELPYQIFHEVDRALQVRRSWASDAFRGLHRRLEIEGRLTHPLSPAEIEQIRMESGPLPESDAAESIAGAAIFRRTF